MSKDGAVVLVDDYLRADDEAFEIWWKKQFWIDGYTDDDKTTAKAGWRAAILWRVADDEKMRLLRSICSDAEKQGWQHITTANLRAVLG